MEFFTIGVYNSTEKEYFSKLTTNNIDFFCDIRRRRGVRGAKYSFVNSNRLQVKLGDLGIRYEHVFDLAPTLEIREVQKQIDSQQNELKRSRNKLGPAFKLAYKEKILRCFNFDVFFKKLNDISANRVVFFCVEEEPEACHRSIVTEKIEKLGYTITHL